MKKKPNAEKEWLESLFPGKMIEEEKEETTPKRVSAKRETKQPARKKACGFGDVAGMEELKRLVTEGFINVLNNRECAKAYGITPPSMLFYGPAGCGKTFFAEKIAEEVGINFIKVVPDDLASTLVHGTQEKIGELFRKAERKWCEIREGHQDPRQRVVVLRARTAWQRGHGATAHVDDHGFGRCHQHPPRLDER